jgi:hypothetical protein
VRDFFSPVLSTSQANLYYNYGFDNHYQISNLRIGSNHKKKEMNKFCIQPATTDNKFHWQTLFYHFYLWVVKACCQLSEPNSIDTIELRLLKLECLPTVFTSWNQRQVELEGTLGTESLCSCIIAERTEAELLFSHSVGCYFTLLFISFAV